MKKLFISIAILGCFVACNKNAVVDPVAVQEKELSIDATEVVYESESTDSDYTADSDEEQESGARTDAAVKKYAVWFQLRTDDFYMFNQPTVRLWSLSDAQCSTLSAATAGTGQNNYTYPSKLGGLSTLGTGKDYIIKKAGPSLYKRIKLKPGNYAIQLRKPADSPTTITEEAKELQIRRFKVTDHELRQTASYSEVFLDKYDGSTNGPGKLKISFWNGAYKPAGIMIYLADYEPGHDDTAYYAPQIEDWQTVPIYLYANRATGAKKTNYVCYPPGTYYAVIADDITGYVYGGQKVTIIPGSKYPHLKISLASTPVTN